MSNPDCHPGQVIDSILAVSRGTAEHKGLPVVTLLDARIKVAVFIETDEEFGYQFLSRRNGEPATIEILFEVGHMYWSNLPNPTW